MIGPGGAGKGNPFYECMGIKRYWRYSKESMARLIADGLVVQTTPGTVPQRKQYLEDGKGVAIQTLWDDIEALSPSSRERPEIHDGIKVYAYLLPAPYNSALRGATLYILSNGTASLSWWNGIWTHLKFHYEEEEPK